ncbi:MAG: ABC transporter permease, partial [Planctomycetes bacterium]|nr:ABC transporter permease [Planctomycetota bacterium]
VTLARVAPTIEEWLAGDATTPLPAAVNNDVVRYGKAFRRVKWTWDQLSREESWSMLRERLTLLRIAQEIDRPDAIVGSVHRLKQVVDRSIRQAMAVLTWLPSLLLPVAAIGIGNLMMVSVQIRARQIAILRAVGALRSQIIRLILAEAIALGVLGAITGVAMGLHQAYSDNRVSAGAGGFYAEFIIPVGTIALGVALTIATCLIAGIIPARRAARSNILSALQAT